MSQNSLEGPGDNRGRSDQPRETPHELAHSSGLNPLGHEAAVCLSGPRGNDSFAINKGGSFIASSFSALTACGKGDWPPKIDLFESSSSLPYFASLDAATKVSGAVPEPGTARPAAGDGFPPQVAHQTVRAHTHIGENTFTSIHLTDHANLDARSEPAARAHDGRHRHHGHSAHHGDREHQVGKADPHHHYETVHKHHDGHYRVGRYGFSGQHLLKFLESLGHLPSPEKIDELMRKGALPDEFASLLKSPDYQAKLKELAEKLESGQSVEKSDLQNFLPPKAQDGIASSLIDRYKGQRGADGQFSVVNTAVDKSLTPLQRGLLDALSGPESGGHYDMLFGGYRLTSYAWHPGKGPSGHTDAGRYQFVRSTWNEVAKTLGLHDFSPASQDKAAWYLAARDYRLNTGHNLNFDLEHGRFNPKGLQNTWVSIKAHGSGAWMTHQFYPAMKRVLSIHRDLATPSDGTNQTPVV